MDWNKPTRTGWNTQQCTVGNKIDWNYVNAAIERHFETTKATQTSLRWILLSQYQLSLETLNIIKKLVLLLQNKGTEK